MLPADERRRSPRHWTAIPVVLRHRGARIEGVSINLSEGGMYLFAAAHLPLGSQIELEYRPHNAKQLVSIIATVRRRALYLYGVEFQGEDASTHDKDRYDSEDRLSNGESEI